MMTLEVAEAKNNFGKSQPRRDLGSPLIAVVRARTTSAKCTKDWLAAYCE